MRTQQDYNRAVAGTAKGIQRHAGHLTLIWLAFMLGIPFAGCLACSACLQ